MHPPGHQGMPIHPCLPLYLMATSALAGEVAWVKRMADVYHEEAARKGVKIVPSCGFDSIPSDLGTLLVVTHMKEKLHRYGIHVSPCHWMAPANTALGKTYIRGQANLHPRSTWHAAVLGRTKQTHPQCQPSLQGLRRS